MPSNIVVLLLRIAVHRMMRFRSNRHDSFWWETIMSSLAEKIDSVLTSPKACGLERRERQGD